MYVMQCGAGGPDHWVGAGHLWRGAAVLGRSGVGQAERLHLKGRND